ncbi:MAG: CopG family transcriptional regulator [Gemmatimonadaceae bacterium]
MRTTLDIADDVLFATKERAHREHRTAGEVVSDLLRQALTTPAPAAVRESKAVYGLTPFARRGGIVTNELIDQLRNEDAY